MTKMLRVTRLYPNRVRIAIRNREIEVERPGIEHRLGVSLGNSVQEAQEAILDAVGEVEPCIFL